MAESDLTGMAHAQMPLTKLLSLEVDEGGPDGVVARGRWEPEHCTAGGLIHGGYLMALADSVGAMCAFFNLPQGATTSTIESKTNFFRPVSSGEITLTATTVHKGRTVVVIQTDVNDEAGRLVSRTTQTQAVISRE